MDNWYEKTLDFERSRRETIKEFEGDKRRVKVNLGKDRTTLVLDVPRQDPNAIKVDKCKESRRCYNYGEMGYLTVRYSRLKKGRVKMRIVEKVREDFS